MRALGPQRVAASDVTAAAEAIARSGKPAVALQGVGKRYGIGAAAVDALAGVDLEVWPAEFVTHNSAIARMADRVVRVRSGRIAASERVGEPVEAGALSSSGWLRRRTCSSRRPPSPSGSRSGPCSPAGSCPATRTSATGGLSGCSRKRS